MNSASVREEQHGQSQRRETRRCSSTRTTPRPPSSQGLLAEVAKYGTAHATRAYGDWTGTSLRGWKDRLLAQSIQSIQQFNYTTGKNATDAALVIDAMDLLYSGRFDGFCLASSDSDVTPASPHGSGSPA